MNIFLSIVFVLSYGCTNAANDIDLEQPLTVAAIQSDQIVHSLREFFGADHVELCAAAEIEQHAPCAAVFFRNLELGLFWSLVDQDRLQGEFRTAYNTLMAMQPQHYQTLFNHPNFRAVLMHVHVVGGIAGTEIFAGKMALRDQSFLVSEEPLSRSEIYDLGEELSPVSINKSVLYFRVGLLCFVAIVIFIGLHSHGII